MADSHQIKDEDNKLVIAHHNNPFSVEKRNFIGSIPRETEEIRPQPMPEEDSLHSTRADAVRNYIELHYAEDLSVRIMAEHFGYSEVYFCKLFKQHFGESFVSFLTRYRIREAQRLLEDEAVNIKDVGRTVGYEDSNYFTKVFRRIMGVSPSEYRASRL